MIDAIIISILAVVIFLAIRYIVKEKAKGRKCIGCPSSGCCSKSCHSEKPINTQ